MVHRSPTIVSSPTATQAAARPPRPVPVIDQTFEFARGGLSNRFASTALDSAGNRIVVGILCEGSDGDCVGLFVGTPDGVTPGEYTNQFAVESVTITDVIDYEHRDWRSSGYYLNSCKRVIALLPEGDGDPDLFEVQDGKFEAVSGPLAADGAC